MGPPVKGKARLASQPAPVEIPNSGNARLDAMGDVFNNALAPFQNAPPAEQGALGVVNQAIGAVMGLQGLGMELMNTGFAMATAGIAAAMPAFPAAFLTVPHIGMPHAHAHPPSLIPPAPPVPLPSIGTVLMAGSVGVLVCGMPAARCGDLGLAVTCGSFSPAFDIFLGSSNTFIAGNRAARMTDMTRHCNPASAALAVSRGAALFSAAVGAVGVAADAAGGGAVTGSIAQIAADLAAAAMSALLGKDPGIPPAMGALMMGAPTVLIGGFPCPNLPDPLSAMMKGLKCLAKKVAKSKGFGKVLNKVGLCNSPGEPIEPATGVVFNEFPEWEDPESGFEWGRHYRSDWNETDGPLGYGHRHRYQQRLTLLRKRAVYEAHDGEMVAIEKRDDGTYADIAGHSLKCTSEEQFELRTDRDEVIDFEIISGSMPEMARPVRYSKGALTLYFYYDGSGRLYALAQQIGAQTLDTRLSYDPEGHIVEVQRGLRAGAPLTIARYAYQDGCIAAWQDVLGATAQFAYGADRRMTRLTDRRGYSFHWQYDAASGRCIKTGGDDGLWGVEARYQASQAVFREPDGGEWTYKFYPDGTVSHILDPDGGVKHYIWDEEKGRIKAQVSPGGITYGWRYDERGVHIGRSDPFRNLLPPEDVNPTARSPLRDRGPVTQAEWLCGRPTWSQPARLAALPRAVNQVLTSIEPVAVRGSVLPPPLRDAANRIVEEPQPDGSRVWRQLDPEGNEIARTDANGNVWRKTFVSWNLVGAEYTPLGYKSEYGYDHREALKYLVDGNGNRTDFVRNKRGALVEVAENGAVRAKYRRNADDHVLELRDGAGNVLVEYKTDARGLDAAATLASGEKYSFGYDHHGYCTEASSTQHEVKLAYHRSDRCRKEDVRDGQGVANQYYTDKLERSFVLGKFLILYGFKDGAQLVRTPDGSNHRFYRTDDSTLVRVNGNGTREALEFDVEDRLCSRVCWTEQDGQSGPSWTTRYRYGAVGELLAAIDNEHGPTSYAYDADNRLVLQRDADGNERQYQYDPGGNVAHTPTHRFIEHTRGNRMVVSHAESFSYDALGRLHKRRAASGVETTHTYDSRGQLLEVSWSDRPERWTAAYDGLGRRVWRQYGDERTEFYWDGDRLAAEIDPKGRVRVYAYANQDALTPFMWLDYDGVDAEPASGKAYYLFAAPTGMPLRVEDAGRNIVWRAQAVDAYGAVTVAEGAEVSLRLRFAGHFLDEHTGLFYNRFRDYDPGVARYIQPDPIGHEGGLNLYAYLSNPNVDVDLRGLIHPKKTGTGEAGKKDPFPPRTKEAREEAKKVVKALNELKAKEPRRTRDKNKVVQVFTHEDGTVSVGISGKPHDAKNRELGDRLANKLNEGHDPPKYRVAPSTDSKHIDEDKLNDHTADRGNERGVCGEPNGSAAAHGHDSPITGHDTRWRGDPETNPHKFEGPNDDGTPAEPGQMKPCNTCADPENRDTYMDHANS